LKISPIILASGFGTRFGENKLLYNINGKAMYRHVVDELINLHLSGVVEKPIVVTQYDKIIQELKNQPVKRVINTNAVEGISASILLGVKAAEDAHGYMFFTADQPYLTSKTIEAFVVGFRKSGKSIGAVANGETIASPTIFLSVYKNELLALTGDKGGKAIIKKYVKNIYVHQVCSKELFDIDIKP